MVAGVTRRRFGISTGLYRRQRLSRDHLREIAALGFETIELAVERGHFDAQSVTAVADLRDWLTETGLELAAVRAPDQSATPEAIDLALLVAQSIPVRTFILRLHGTRETARRTAVHAVEAAGPLGVHIALELAADALGRAGSLVHFLEDDLDQTGGICFDFGQARLAGDVVEAIETVAGHVIATHVHDGRGRIDDHLIPFDGAIEWPSALTALQKVGYDGPLTMDIRAHGSTKDALRKAKKARERLERLLFTT